MIRLIVSLCLLVPCLAMASDACWPRSQDPVSPDRVTTTYDVVGRDSGGAAYTGTVLLRESGGDSTLSVTRTVGERVDTGSARVLDCSGATTLILQFTYDAKPEEEYWCYFSDDNGPDYRMGCTARSKSGTRVLEAWFRRND